jgi:hypothetical protein
VTAADAIVVAAHCAAGCSATAGATGFDWADAGIDSASTTVATAASTDRNLEDMEE